MYDPSKLFTGLADEIVEIFSTTFDFEIDPIGLELIEEVRDDEHST